MEEKMKKNIFAIFCSMILLLFTSFSFADTKANDGAGYYAVDWSLLLSLYKIDNYLSEHKMTITELSSDSDFVKMISATFTPDSNTALIDQNAKYIMHPDKSLIGKRMAEISGAGQALTIANEAIKDDTCSKGFYMWIDNTEKFMVVCPLVGKTKDGSKLYYFYTMHVRSMPQGYVKALKKSL